MNDEPQEMPLLLFREILRQFDDLVASMRPKHHWLQVTGGEPLLHLHIWDLLALAARRFPTKLLTNGMLITPHIAKQLQNLGVSVQISFDGLQPVHDTRRGAGAFDAAWQGLMYLKEAGVPCRARMTIGKENQDEVEALLEKLTPYIEAFHISRVVPIATCDVESPDTERYRQLIYRLYGLHTQIQTIRLRDPFFGVLLQTEDIKTCFAGCSAGISGLCVIENGDVYPCRRLPIKVGNVQEQTLADVYQSHDLLHKLRQRELSEACGTCEDKRVCGGSRCIAYAVTGDPLGSDPGCIFQNADSTDEIHTGHLSPGMPQNPVCENPNPKKPKSTKRKKDDRNHES